MSYPAPSSRRRKQILFLCKDRHGSGGQSCSGRFGLWNSASLLASSLPHDCKVIAAIDANCIDRLVTENKPDVAVIEALWVTPEKLAEVQRLHPSVTWIIRIHSKASFLAQEGIALEWIAGYRGVPNVTVSVNNAEFAQDLKKIGYAVEYLPNVYEPQPQSDKSIRRVKADFLRSSIGMPDGSQVHIGCFGALRPLKNHLAQAIAAIQFADKIGRELHFHINANTDEQSNAVLKNLRALFAGTKHTLAEHDWLPHDEFCDLVSCMDIGMQVSLSESFNIVTGDFIHAGVPVVVSKEIKFAGWLWRTDNTTPAIVRTLLLAWYTRGTGFNKRLLAAHNISAKQAWVTFLEDAA